MTLTVDDGQAAISDQPGASCVPIVVLTTYTDRDTKVVDNVYYWTRGPTIYYENVPGSPQTFAPIINEISPVVRGFNHLPDASDFNIREGMRFIIDTTPVGISGGAISSHFLWKELVDQNIIGARIEVGSLLINYAGPPGEANDGWYDLTAWGRVHQPRWRGEVTQLPEIANDGHTFEIVAETEDTKIAASRIMAGNPYADPLDAARPYPVPIGTQFVEALWFDAGFKGELKTSIGTAPTTITVVCDESLWPRTAANPNDKHAQWTRTGSDPRDQVYEGIIYIGDSPTQESIDGCYYEAVSVATGEITFSGCTARARTHSAGDSVWFQPKYQRFALSGGPVADVGDIYVTTETVSRQLLVTPTTGQSNRKVYNDPNGDAGGHVALLAFDTQGQQSTYIVPLADRSKSILEVECLGTYTVGTTATVLLDNSVHGVSFITDNADSDATDWINRQSLKNSTFGVGRCLFTNTSAEVITVGINQDGPNNCRTHFIHLYTGSIAAPAQVEFTLNLPQACLDILDDVSASVSPPFYQSSGWEGCGFWPIEDLVAGDNRFIFQVWTTASNLTLRIVINDEYAEEDFTIEGDVISYPLTVSSGVGAHPIDVAETIVNDFVTVDSVTVDSSSFATTKTNTPSLEVSADLSHWRTLGEVLAVLGFNSRINFVLSETYTGTELKAFSAETDYDFPAAGKVIGDDYRDFRASVRSLSEISNAYTALYDIAPNTGAELFSSYRKTLSASVTDNTLVTKVPTVDMTTSVANFGARPSIELPFLMLDHEPTLIDVLGYYATESLRGQVPRYSCFVPWWVGYDLEAGDIVSIEPPWEGSAVKCRVVQTAFNFDENAVGINLEGVT